MRIVTQAIRVIDYENNRVLVREIMPNFSEYIEQLINYINNNKSIRKYKTLSAKTEVITEILEILQHPEETEIIIGNINLIAMRLLQKEKEANEKIIHLTTNVQKGSLIFAWIEQEGKNIFLLAKVEHTDFFDDVDYSIKSGFSKDTKKIWKTCWFEIEDIHATEFQAKIYSNTVAKYWWHDFLELVELHSDESNTKKAFRSVESILNRNLKKVAPHAHMIIRNAIYLYFNSVEQFDYDNMLEMAIKNYKSDDMSKELKENLLEKLEALPEEKGFDHQFTPIPEIIKSKMRQTYEVYNGIQLRIPGGMEELRDVIWAQEDEDGKRYLKIRVNNDNTYRTFERDK